MPGHFVLRWPGATALVFAGLSIGAPPQAPPLRHLAEAKRLNNTDANHHYPIRATVQIIGLDPWGGAFLQEDDLGMYSFASNKKILTGIKLGDWVQITGTTDHGSYGPLLRISALAKLRAGAPPNAHLLTKADLQDPDVENFWAKARGKVKRIRQLKPFDFTAASVLVGDVEIPIKFHAGPSRVSFEHLVEAEVEVEGVYGSLRGGHDRQAEGVLYINSLDQVHILKRAPPADWSIPFTDLEQVLAYRSPVHDKDTVRVRGILIRNSGELGVLQSGTQGVQLEFAKPVNVLVGETYEALGVIQKSGGPHVILRGALLRASPTRASIDIRKVDLEALIVRNFGDSLVRVAGKVVASAQVSDNYVGTLVMGKLRAIAILPVEAAGGQNPFPIEATIEVTGVLEFSGDDWSGVEEVNLICRGTNDIRVIQVRPWTETFPFALVALGGLILVALALVWIRVLRGTVERRTEQLEQRTVALEKARIEAVQGTRAKSMFLANMSHEIRTPLNGILGMNQLLLDSPLSSEQKEWSQSLDYSGRRLLSLLNDVLDLSKVESGQLTIEAVPFVAAQLVDELRALYKQSALSKNIALHVKLDPTMPAVLIGDPLRIRQIIGNYLSNAIKFTTAGAVTIETIWREKRLRISVRDTGIGLTTEALDRMFQRFEQADLSTTRRFGGTGLGLAICRQLAEAMGGATGCTSKLGEGSEFWVELPLEASAAPAPEVQPDQSANRAVCEGRKILVAEDNVVNQRVIVRMLKNLGASVELAENGLVAVEKFKAESFDLVLLDWQMPVMDGYQAAVQIRNMEDSSRRTRTPVIAFTASVITNEIDLCLSSGMDAVVGKPILVEDLKSMLRQWLPARDGETSAPVRPAVTA